MLIREAAQAELIRSNAASIRADTKSRLIIVCTLCTLIVLIVIYLIVASILQNSGVWQDTGFTRIFVGPGSALAALIAALVWMLRRPR